jgi:hypothetical protein
MSHARIFLMSLVAAAALAPAAAQAQHTATATFTPATTGNGKGFGVGAVMMLNPNADGALSQNLLGTWGDEGGRFHVEGLFGLHRENRTNYDLGARFWYHVHTARLADFSLGGGLAMFAWKPTQGADRLYDFELDVGSQMRVFIVPNVALLGSVGIGLYFRDNGPDDIRINGQAGLNGALGLAYYFE